MRKRQDKPRLKTCYDGCLKLHRRIGNLKPERFNLVPLRWIGGQPLQARDRQSQTDKPSTFYLEWKHVLSLTSCGDTLQQAGEAVEASRFFKKILKQSGLCLRSKDRSDYFSLGLFYTSAQNGFARPGAKCLCPSAVEDRGDRCWVMQFPGMPCYCNLIVRAESRVSSSPTMPPQH